MTIPFWCVLAACVLPYIISGVGAYYRLKLPGGVDNKNPRQQAARLEGTGARAYAAQQNAWEALPIFIAAVCVAHLAGVPPEKATAPALVFIGARVGHLVAYLADQDKLRSLCWALGFGCCMALFGLAINT
ncbi:MAG: MAPEG family protein [Candidatus Sericytochromatia bacterium]|nr:MAPEG family protein [Candidatus Sericytochromatia bacterium]